MMANGMAMYGAGDPGYDQNGDPAGGDIGAGGYDNASDDSEFDPFDGELGDVLTPQQLGARWATLPPEQQQAFLQAVSNPAVLGVFVQLLGPAYLETLSTMTANAQTDPGATPPPGLGAAGNGLPGGSPGLPPMGLPLPAGTPPGGMPPTVALPPGMPPSLPGPGGVGNAPPPMPQGPGAPPPGLGLPKRPGPPAPGLRGIVAAAGPGGPRPPVKR
jgi:hypothetical protein